MTDDIETLRRGNERLQVALAEAHAAREACAQRAFRLESENERLREELRQSSIDHTCAEVERLREALTVAAKAELYDPATGIVDADVLAIVQDTARAALQGETAIWSARHDPRE